MVRTIDAVARRRALAEAVWRIVLREGLSAASVRTVAAESGLSAGSVRHFFGTQRELIVFAMTELIDGVRERIERATLIADPEQRALAVLAELLPLNEATHAEAFAWLQFVNQAQFDPELREIAAESFDGLRRTYAGVVQLLVDAGRLPADLDVPASGATLGGLVDGLMLHILLGPNLITPDTAQALVREFLRTLARTSKE